MSDAARPLAGASVCVAGINFAPESTGIAPFTTGMAHALADAGAKVTVVTGVPHYPEWSVAPAYRRTIRRTETDGSVVVQRRRHWVPAQADLAGRVAMEATFALHILPTIRRSAADAIIAVTPSFGGVLGAALARRGRPLGVVVQDLTGNAAAESGSAGAGVSRRLASVEYRTLAKATRVGVIARRFGTILAEHGVAEDRIDFLPNFAAIAPYPGSKAQARQELGWDPERYLVVHAGNMGRKQGLDTVIAAARLADARGDGPTFVLIGDGAVRAELGRAAEGVKSVEFVPAMPATEVPRPLAAADALLVIEKPGILEMSLPSKLTSYALAERPVIAAVEPGGITHADLVSSGMAELVRPGDPAALLAAVDRIRAAPERQAELVASSRRAARERYDRAAAEARYVQFAEKLLG